MQLELQDFAQRAVSPFIELGAYEALWEEPNTTFKTLADLFAKREGTIPSDFVERDKAVRYANEVHWKLKSAGIERYGVRVHGAGEYPVRLRDADHPVELLYFQGWWELINSPRSIAVVGTRNPSPEGLARTNRLVTALVHDNFTIVSGLATGIDAAAHHLVLNFKKPTKHKGKPSWQYKIGAISAVARAFSENLGSALATLTLVPIPPSKTKTDPEYDDRLMDMLRQLRAPQGIKTDVRELIVQTRTMPASHESENRLPPSEWEGLPDR
jgi:hypothetical protein